MESGGAQRGAILAGERGDVYIIRVGFLTRANHPIVRGCVKVVREVKGTHMQATIRANKNCKKIND
ncbi:MAG: hypothetical protein AB7O96_13800 [Pseudobdellovibrionaceae bacterium]